MILVVEANIDNRMIIEYILKSFNYWPVFSNTGKQAIHLAQKYLPSLIIVEILLPDMSGLELIAYLKTNPLTNNIPILMATSLTIPQTLKTIFSADGYGYISKPYLFEDFENIIGHFLQPQLHKWWLEINTAVPNVTYYFGPFESYIEAQQHQSGYIQDLVAEKAAEITVKIKKTHPLHLTIDRTIAQTPTTAM
ncbi:MAG: DUF1816 domain-containing protein [Prochloraceae cyanobacterium]